jgi:protein TilB
MFDVLHVCLLILVTEGLVRQKAEHNNCELSTLEEVSLHQLDIERY